MDPWNPRSRMNARPSPQDPLDHATVNIEKIQANIRGMDKLARKLGSEDDTHELRERMHEGRRVTNGLCKETTNLLRQPVDRAMRPKQDKLKRTLQQCTQQFQEKASEHRRREREIIVALEERYSQTYGSPPDLSRFEQGGLQVELDEGQMDDVDIAIIQDRNRDIEQLDRDMSQLADVFADVNQMVQEQGQQLDHAASNVETTETNVEYARENLQQTEKWVNRRRCKILIIVLVCVAIVAIIIGATVGWACSSAGPLNC